MSIEWFVLVEGGVPKLAIQGANKALELLCKDFKLTPSESRAIDRARIKMPDEILLVGYELGLGNSRADRRLRRVHVVGP